MTPITATLFAQTGIQRPLLRLLLVETVMLGPPLMFSKLPASLLPRDITSCFACPLLQDSGGSSYKAPCLNQLTVVGLSEAVALVGS